ncbi:hypothetical protein [Bradyrhizobium sp. URHD0069]|uniref:hypothetical protein n=1 Tax=Bradyrhizobium sp. URHD0069 TaxID=1380355 RepID=UPI001AEBACC8|nr:hypothetical protein [Bradyrhizobium sp. URHD0069]
MLSCSAGFSGIWNDRFLAQSGQSGFRAQARTRFSRTARRKWMASYHERNALPPKIVYRQIWFSAGEFSCATDQISEENLNVGFATFRRQNS